MTSVPTGGSLHDATSDLAPRHDQRIASPPLPLDLGEPRVPLPAPLAAAAARMIAPDLAVDTYAPPNGLSTLRRLIAERATRQYGLPVATECVTVTHGASSALAAAILALASAGDTILVPDPGYPAFRALALMFGRHVVGYPAVALDAAATRDALDAAGSTDPRLLIWNSPANPTGAVASAQACATAASWAREHGASVLADDVYATLVYHGSAMSPFTDLHGAFPVIALGSLCKALAAPAVRIGYAIAAPDLIGEVTRRHWTLNMSAGTLGQRVAVALLSAGDMLAAHVASVLARRRNAAVDVLRAEWPSLRAPDSGLFLWIDVSAATDDDRQFARICLSDAGVAVTPGAAFGANGRGFIRLSFGGDGDLVIEGARRIVRIHRSLREAR